MAFIDTLAHSCPFDRGDAVYTARALYNFYHPTEIGLNDALICAEDSTQDYGYKMSSENKNSNNLVDSAVSRLAFATIAPNPASNATTIIYNSGYASYNKTEIYDNLGRLILDNRVVGSSGKIEIDLSSVHDGVYMVRFTADDKVLLSTKIVISKW